VIHPHVNNHDGSKTITKPHIIIQKVLCICTTNCSCRV